MASTLRGGSRERHDALFTALANHRRRFTLYACREANGELTLSDLAEQVAAWEYDKDRGALTSDERKRVYTSLQQHHLPKLEDAGLIKLNGDRIETTEQAGEVDFYLEVVTPDTIPWSLFYLGYGLVGAFALVIVWFTELPDFISVDLVATLLLIGLAISAVAHHLDTRQKHLASAELPDPDE